MPGSSILSVPKNTRGKDYFLGDLHGRLDLLKKAMRELGAHDRLFLVGDLVDRGPDSLGVLRQIIKENEKHASPIIYSVRGNHENIALEFLTQRKILRDRYSLSHEQFDQDLDNVYDDLRAKASERTDEVSDIIDRIEAARKESLEVRKLLIKKIKQYRKEKKGDANKPMDLLLGLESFRRTAPEIVTQYAELGQIIQNGENKLQELKQDAATLKNNYLEFKKMYDEYIKTRDFMWNLDNPRAFGRRNLWLNELNEVEAEGVLSFLSQLPFIIESEKFGVVHADLPFSREELKKRVNNNQLDLSEEERIYATWARNTGSIRKIDARNKATALDLYIICGHTIAEGLRMLSKHINVDFGAFYTGCLAMLNLDDRFIKLIGNAESQFENGKKAKDLAAQMMSQLKQADQLTDVSEQKVAKHTRKFSDVQRDSTDKHNQAANKKVKMTTTKPQKEKLQLKNITLRSRPK